jgi:hypothetical protein
MPKRRNNRLPIIMEHDNNQLINTFYPTTTSRGFLKVTLLYSPQSICVGVDWNRI